MSLHVLLVDDEPLIVSAASRALRMKGCTVTTALGGEEALAVLEREDVDVLLSDVWMPGTDGLMLLARSRELYPELPVVLFSGASFSQMEAQALRAGAAAYLAKPLDVRTLIPVLEAVVRGVEDAGP